jgi:hypothetical protein
MKGEKNVICYPSECESMEDGIADPFHAESFRMFYHEMLR